MFCKATKREAECLKNILNKYEALSGQKVNFQKSNVLFSKNTLMSRRTEIVSALQVSEEENLGFYLGLPTSIGRRRVDCFSYIKERVVKRIEGWKERSLSLAGKEVLIKAVAQAIPTYVMGVVSLPIEICTQIETIMNRYWWRSNNGRGIHWMSWQRMAYPKQFGGLGFRTLRDFNVAMLAKQGWRIMNRPDTLAAKLLKCKYFPTTEFLEASIHEGSRPSYTWRSIMEAQYLLRVGCRRRVGEGRSISIWEDKWLPSFPFHVSTTAREDEEVLMVSDLIDENTRRWNLGVLEQTFDVEDVNNILSIPLAPTSSKDGWVWIYETKGHYTVRSGTHRAVDLRRMEAGLSIFSNDTPWRYIWSATAPDYAKIWQWRACHNTLPVRMRLLDKGSDCDPICPMCGKEGESLMHLICDCDFAKEVLRRSNVHNQASLLPRTNYADVLSHIGSEWSSRNRDMWFVLCSLIWQARNDRVWNAKEPSAIAVTTTAPRLLEEWLQIHVSHDTSSPASLGLWHPPTPYLWKINVDCSFLPHERIAGGGMVLRDHVGKIVEATAVPFHGICDPFIGEALAMLQAMEWAIRRGWREVCFETDCAALVTAMQARCNSYASEVGEILVEGIRRKQDFRTISFVHVRRTGNRVADCIARYATHLNDPQEWTMDFPSQFVELAAEDVRHRSN